MLTALITFCLSCTQTSCTTLGEWVGDNLLMWEARSPYWLVSGDKHL